MNLLESFLYGLISGFAEILPVSAEAHQLLLDRLLGLEAGHHFLNIFMRISVLAALIFSCRKEIMSLRSFAARGRQPRPTAESRLVRTAVIPLLLGFFLVPYVRFLGQKLPLLALMLLANGLILYIPCRMLQGNKDARSMSGWDGLLIGFFGVAGVVPGLSRLGALVSVATARGADRQKALIWGLLICVPALLVVLFLDVVAAFRYGGGISAGFLGTLLAMLGAGAGCYFGVKLLRYLAVKAGFASFAFYCWGAALFTFVMYLTVV